MEVSFRDLAYVKATIRNFISKKSLDLVNDYKRDTGLR